MRIAIAGGTGTLGRRVAAELRSRGHDVRVLSRSSPEYRVDLTTGEGLADALVGCDVVVDASNSQSSAKQAAQTLVEGSRRLLAAEEAAGVGHHVCVSIVGCDQLPMGYFKVKADQEAVVEHGPVPWTVVRATQFHELMDMAFTAGARWRVLPVPRGRLQTVACAEVARAVADVAEAAPRHGRFEVAGPETVDVRALARRWRALTGRRALLLPLPLPGRTGRALRAGVATSERPRLAAHHPEGSLWTCLMCPDRVWVWPY
ncbi:NAD(P)H-binding protein [Streptomyces sp. NPDC048479]|uniref:SDR family oxidoreductase n=1 Tax=Streptomyces sp. NPDC048479 TaxID=3154725 RepID=UPI00343B245F